MHLHCLNAGNVGAFKGCVQICQKELPTLFLFRDCISTSKKFVIAILLVVCTSRHILSENPFRLSFLE